MTQKVIFTREHTLDGELVENLIESGFEVHHVPLIACQPNPLPEEILGVISQADWVFFTSAVAVDSFTPYNQEKLLKIATIGPQTTLAVKSKGKTVDFETSSHYAVDFVAEWLENVSEKQVVLLPQSSLSNPIIAEELKKAGHRVYAWAMYDTQSNPVGQAMISSHLADNDVIWAFASPSAWDSFSDIVHDLPKTHQLAVIGTSTAKSIVRDGFQVAIMPETPSIKAMVETIIAQKGVNLCLKDTAD